MEILVCVCLSVHNNSPNTQWNQVVMHTTYSDFIESSWHVCHLIRGIWIKLTHNNFTKYKLTKCRVTKLSASKCRATKHKPQNKKLPNHNPQSLQMQNHQTQCFSIVNLSLTELGNAKLLRKCNVTKSKAPKPQHTKLANAKPPNTMLLDCKFTTHRVTNSPADVHKCAYLAQLH